MSSFFDETGELIDKATGGRFSDQVGSVQEKARDAVDHLDDADAPTPPSGPGH